MTERGNKKQLVGLVASDKTDKTVVVEVTRRTMHPIYHKYISRRKRYQAHDETNDCRVGDRVLIPAELVDSDDAARSPPVASAANWPDAKEPRTPGALSFGVI